MERWFFVRLLLVLLVYLAQDVVHPLSFENTETKDITKNNSPIESVVHVTGFNTPLSTLTVQIWLTHDYPGEVEIGLYGPDGSNVILSDKKGGEYKNVFAGTLFIDSAKDSVSTDLNSNVVVSPLKPEQPLSNFKGKNPNGQWKLQINDTGCRGTGKLTRFKLDIQGKVNYN